MEKPGAPRHPFHVVEILEATAGGTRTHILQLLQGLKERNLQMTLVASTARNPAFRKDMERLQAMGIHVIEIPMVRQVAPWRDVTSLVKLRRVLRSLAPDIVHTHASKAGILGRIAARLSGVRTVVHTPHVYYFQGRRGLSHRLFRLLERMALPLTTKTVLLCESQRELAQRELGIHADGVAVIQNGVDTTHFSPRNDKLHARRTLGIPIDGPVIGTVTRFMPQKGCDTFLRGLARVLGQRPECSGLIAGEGPLEADLRLLVQDLGIGSRIHWRKENPDPREIYAALDVFALSSHYEGLPYALLEAMAMGLPVVATRVTGCLDVISDGENGLLVPENDSAALANAVLGLLHHPEQARKFGLASRETVKHSYSIEAFLDGMARLYTDLAE